MIDNLRSTLLLMLLFLGTSMGLMAQHMVLEGEYFWDTDPGQGNGMPLVAADGNFDEALEEALLNTTNSPAVGLHVFHVRIKGQDGSWSPTFAQVVNVQATPLSTSHAINLTAAEYFWDTDPGQGNGTPLVAFDGNFDEAIETAFSNTPPATAPTVGLHLFSIRVLGQDGTWSPVFSQVIDVEATPLTTGHQINLTAAEYFWDVDPGQGNGTPLVAFDGNFNQAIETAFSNTVPAALPANGLHQFSIRVLGQDGAWSPVFSQVVNVDNTPLATGHQINLTAAEYFWDIDPGQGNGTPLVAFDGNFNQAIETAFSNTVPATLPSNGLHQFSIRVLGQDGAWSPVFSQVVNVDSTPLTTGHQINLVAAECFWDIDPGQGNGIPLLAFDGNFDEALETIGDSLTTFNLTLGPHALYTRVQGQDGTWSPVFGQVVEIDTSLFPVITAIVGDSTFCTNSNLNNISYSASSQPNATYNWTVVGGTLVSGGSTNVITVNWNANAPSHEVRLQACNSFGCGNTFVKTIVIAPVPTASITTSTGRDSLCLGEVLTLSANAVANATYLWSNGATTPSISVTTSGNYRVTVTSAGGCSASTSKTISAFFLPPANITTNTGVSSICLGSDLTLNAPIGNSYTYQWSTGATSANIVVTNANVYQLTVTNTNTGCSNTSQINTTIANPPIATITTNTGSDSTCAGTSLTLTSGIGSYTYLWSTGSNLSNISVNATGTYVLTVTDNATRCTATAQKSITVLPPPSANITTNTGRDSFCVGETLTLSANSGTNTTYLWSTGATTPTIGVTTSGTYSVTVSNSIGCTAVINKTVVASALPVTTIGTSTGTNSICLGDSLTLSAPSGANLNYQWSTGATSDSIVVTNATSYQLIVTNTQTGCIDSSQINVLTNAPPVALITTNTGSDSTCTGTSLTLTASSGNYTYLWSDTTNNASIVVDSTGSYSVTITDNATGCKATAQKNITVLPPPVVTITTNTGRDSFCVGETLTLSANTVANATYLWSTGVTSPSISVNNSGTYSVTISTPDGCVATTGKTVLALALPATTITTNTGGTGLCLGDSLTLTAPGNSNYNYQWNTGAISQSILVGTANTYQLTVTDVIAGCSATNQIAVTASAPPVAVITSSTGQDSLCAGNSLTLSANSGNFSYLWNDGSTNASLLVNNTGTYRVTITDNTTGCVDTADKTILVVALPPVAITTNTGRDSFCAGDSLMLMANGGNLGYGWSTGASSQNILVGATGTYALTVTDLGTGCTASSQQTVYQTQIDTSISVAGNVLFASANNDAYQWLDCQTGQPIAGANSASYTFVGSGQYAVILTKNGCQDTSNCRTVTVISTTSLPTTGLEDILVYPNPNEGVFTIDFKAYPRQDAVIELWNVLGQRLYQGQRQGDVQTLQQQNLPTGVYWLRIDGQLVERLVIE